MLPVALESLPPGWTGSSGTVPESVFPFPVEVPCFFEQFPIGSRAVDGEVHAAKVILQAVLSFLYIIIK